MGEFILNRIRNREEEIWNGYRWTRGARKRIAKKLSITDLKTIFRY